MSIKIINELEKILSEKKITKNDLISLTGLTELKINNILKNKLDKISIKEIKTNCFFLVMKRLPA